jgi:tetratricopeptide (TPR) repeat protein
MKKIITLLIIIIFNFTVLANDLSKAEAMATAKDYLGLRIQLIKSYNNPISYQEWVKFRRLIYDTPQVGYDIVFAWDQHKRVTQMPEEATEQLVEKVIKKAEELHSERQYQKAFDLYQLAATRIKKTYKSKVGKENKNIYYWLLHQMGRTLYSSGNYEQALEVYNWIPTKYYQFRQVQFEKMWTAFRMNKLDIAMGSIVSQQSAFYSKYIEPESYLVKLYILQKLCDQKEVSKVIRDIDNYISQIKLKKLKLSEWAKNDLYDYSISLLARVNETEGLTSLVSTQERLEQKNKIIKKLNLKFADDQVRLERDLKKVKGYALLMKFDVTEELEKVTSLPTSDILSSQGLEYWPTSKNEEWVDEAGQYFYNGESKCKKKPAPEEIK